MSDPAPDLEGAVNDYVRNFGAYHACTERFKQLLEEVLEEHKSSIAVIEARTKSPESLRGKLTRKNLQFDEVQDLCAIRIVTFYAEDVAVISSAIEAELCVESPKDDKSLSHDADKFGYSSVHYIVSLDSQRAKQKDFAKCHGRLVEVQVRSVLQHAWAAIEHKLQYKNELSIPKEIRRGLSRLSAVLELADEEFSRLRSDWERVREEYEARASHGDYADEINLDSLRLFLLHSGISGKWADIAALAGWSVERDETSVPEPEWFLLKMLQIMYFAGIDTIGQLSRILARAETWGPGELRVMHESLPSLIVPEMFIVTIVTAIALTERLYFSEFMHLGFSTEVDNYMYSRFPFHPEPEDDLDDDPDLDDEFEPDEDWEV